MKVANIAFLSGALIATGLWMTSTWSGSWILCLVGGLGTGTVLTLIDKK